MLNEIADFKAYTEKPIYKRDNKTTTVFLADSLVRAYKALRAFRGC